MKISELQAQGKSVTATPGIPASSGTPLKLSTIDRSKITTTAPTAPEPTLLSRASESVAERAESLRKRVDETAGATISPQERGLYVAGEAVALGGDLVVDAIAQFTPKSVKEGVKGLLKSVADTDAGKAGIAAAKQGAQMYEEFKKANPRVANALESAVSVASAIPAAKAPKVAADVSTSAVGGIVSGTGKTLEFVGDKTVKPVVNKVAKKVQEAKMAARPAEVDKLEQTYIELAGTTQRTNKVLKKAQAATEKKNKAGTTGLSPERFLAEMGVIPAQKGTRLTTLEQADAVRALAPRFREVNRASLKALEPSTPKTKLSDLEEQAVKAARTDKNIAAGVADDLETNIRDAFATYRKNYGEEVPLTTVDDIKSARWEDTKFDSSKPLKRDVNYLIGKAAQKNIEDVARAGGANDIADVNRYIGDLLESGRFLEALDNKIVKRGHIGKYAIQGIGAVAGSAHGPLGTILGAVGGDAIANILISNSVAGPFKRFILKGIEMEDPAAYTKAVAWLEKENLLRETRLKLPSGTTDGVPNVINVGGRADTSGVSVVPAAKGLVGQSPESGRFFGTYTSAASPEAAKTAVSRYSGAVDSSTAGSTPNASPRGSQGLKEGVSVTRYSEKPVNEVPRETSKKKTNAQKSPKKKTTR